MAVERPHKDRILITSASPDAFEEPLWRQFFPAQHEPGANQRLTAEVSHPKFEAFYRDHLRKILLLRGAPRYVSKGNYNVGRIEYLAKLFPDAVFVVPVRRPLEHVASLCRQHALFASYGEADPRVPLYLAAAGHFEFGLQRRSLVLGNGAAERQAGLGTGDDVLGYAQQWVEVYGHVERLMAQPELAGRILLVRYEDFCAAPEQGLDAILAHAGLADADGTVRAFAAQISASPELIPPVIAARRNEILSIVGDLASRLGCTPP
jgi:Sulfotransferase family